MTRQITYASTSSASRNGQFSESDPATGASGLGANRNQDSSGNSNNAVSRRQLVESVISRLLGGSSQASSIDLTSSLIPNALTVLQQQQQVGQLQQPLQQHQPQQLRHLQQPIIQQLQQQQQQGAGQSSNPRGQSGDDLLTTSVPLLLSQLLQLQRGRQVAMNPAASSEQQIQQGQPQYHGQQLHRPGGAQIAASASQEAAERSSGQSAFPLYMPRDKECLSSYQCLLRQQIELFAAGSEDVKSTMPGRNKAIVLGQVGIRCRHCAMLPARHRGTGATYYPAKLDRVSVFNIIRD